MKYKFEYIKDNVLQWRNDLLENITVSDVINAIPFEVMLPRVMPDECKPAVDHYGMEIEDIDDWDASESRVHQETRRRNQKRHRLITSGCL